MNTTTVVNEARAALYNRRPDIATSMLCSYLSKNSRDVDARYYNARSLSALERWEDAVLEYRLLLEIVPGHVPGLIDLGVVLTTLDRHAAAMAALENARVIEPRRAELHFALGLCHLKQGAVSAAETSLREAIALGYDFPHAHERLGATLLQMQRNAEAAQQFQHALALLPCFTEALTGLGDAEMRLGNYHAAASAYQRSLSAQPNNAYVEAALGTTLLCANDATGAVQPLRRALALQPELVAAALNLGIALRRMGRTDEAIAAYQHVLAHEPGHAQALLELGTLHALQHDTDRALPALMAAYDRKPSDPATALKVSHELESLGHSADALGIYARIAQVLPDNAEVQDEWGRLHHRLGSYAAAVARYERALEIEPGRLNTQLTRANAYEALGDLSKAIECFELALTTAPDEAEAIAGLASCAFRSCDWDLRERTLAKLRETEHGLDALHPFLHFAADLTPSELNNSAQRRSASIAQRSPESALPAYKHDRLRVAYVSADFGQHPVCYALAAIVRGHDRRRIESIGVSLRPTDHSDMAREFAGSFDRFVDAASMSNAQLVQLLRSQEVDVAVDLAGFTMGARPDVFASRVAPIQVSYLGYPGSTGAGYIDFLIADATVVPCGHESRYIESVVRLPHSYLPFDRSRKIGAPWTRVDAGLPTGSPVFCAFSSGYKISRGMFDIWVRLLRETPGSVLWLRGGHHLMERKLCAAAAQLGVAPDRLVFASFLPRIEDHLARLQLADLFLDTMPYNAHTTAAEALWAGVPVVTCAGEAFAGRVGASVLHAAGLTDLVCADPGSYFDCALALARSPEARELMRERLRQARLTAPMFDTPKYIRCFEDALMNLRSRRA